MKYYFFNKKQQRIACLLLFAFACIIAIITLSKHEMWRDESQAFLLVRDSDNLKDLWHNTRYEGHPFLWHFILFISCHFFPSVYTIQVVHIAIGLVVIALLIFCSPFSFLEKCLLTFSYFFSYEYLIISRNYSVGIMLVFISLCLYLKKRSSKQVILLAIITGLCANSNVYCMFISCWLFFYFLLEYFPANKSSTYRSPVFYVAGVIFCILLTVSLVQLIPPLDRKPSPKIAKVVSFTKFNKVSQEISQALFYLPPPLKINSFWNKSLFEEKVFSSEGLNKMFRIIPPLLAISLLIFLLLSLSRSPLKILFYAGSFTTLLLFMLFVFDKGHLRHTGSFFVLIIAVFWLYRSSDIIPGSIKIFTNFFFGLLLWMQFVASLGAHYGEIKYPFSGAKDAADFLIKSHRNNDKILLHPDYEGLAVLHYGGIKQVYYGTIQAKGSFIKFNDKRKPVSYNDLYYFALKEQLETMIYTGRQNDSIINKIGYRLLYSQKISPIVADESFYIYGKK